MARVWKNSSAFKRIYHRGNIKLNVWWESYFYPRILLFTAIKEITILFSTHWQKLWKSGEEDWQTVSRNSSRIKASRKTQGRLLLSYNWMRISFRDFQSFTGFFQKRRSLWGLGGGGGFNQFCLFICCTEDHTCTVVNDGTCVLRDHTVNWRQSSFIPVFFSSASVLSRTRHS